MSVWQVQKILVEKKLHLRFANSHNVSSDYIFTPTDLSAVSGSASPLFDTNLTPQEDRLLQKLLLARRMKTRVPSKKRAGRTPSSGFLVV